MNNIGVLLGFSLFTEARAVSNISVEVHPCAVGLVEARGSAGIMPFKVPKKEIARAGAIYIARTRYRAPRIPPTQRAGGLISLGGPPCPDVNYTGGRGNVPSISMPFGGSFEEIWPFFRRTEWPRNYPGSVIRSSPVPEVAARR